MRRGPALLLAGLASLLLLALTFRPVVDGDGVNYFAYLHTLVIDRDLDFSDEYAAAQAAGETVNATLVGTRTPTGLVANFQPVGAALLALPFYLVAVAVKAGGEPQYDPPFLIAFTIASLFYGLLALALCQRLAAAVTGSRSAAAAGTLVAAGATPFVYYLLWAPSYAHTFSAFLASAFVLLWWRARGKLSAPSWLALGVLGGAMAAVRYQDGLVIGLVLIDLGRARWRLLLFAAGAALGFAPQVLVNHFLFGAWLPFRPEGFALQPWPGHYLEVLLSSHNGLLTWTPVALAAAAGYVLLPDRRLRLAAGYALLVELAIEGAAPDWWGGHAFGMRRFLVLLPLAAVGLGAVARRLGPRLAAAAGALVTAWNLLLVANFEYVIRTDRDVGYWALLRGQAEALGSLPRLFAQGGVVRSLLLWAPLHRPFDPVPGIVLLLLEAACLAVALAVAGRGRPTRLNTVA